MFSENNVAIFPFRKAIRWLRKQSTSGVQTPVCSGREIAQNTDTRKTSVFSILHSVLHLYPCKFQSLQQLISDDTD